MSQLQRNVLLRIVKMFNVILITAAFAIAWLVFYYPKTLNHDSDIVAVLIVVLFAAGYFIFARIYDGFLVSHHRISEMVYSQMLAAVIADCFLMVVIGLLTMRFPNLLPAFGVLGMQLLLSLLWSLFAHNWYFHTFPAKITGIIFDTYDNLQNLISEYGLDKKFNVVLTITSQECIADLSSLDALEAVFLCDIHSHERNIILKHCIESHTNVYVIPRIGDVIMSGAVRMHMFHLPVLRVGRYNPNPEFLFWKRTFDILISSAALVILSPILLVTAIAVKCTDGGPIFYRQCRLTRNGKKFNVLKFRSMRTDAEANGVARLSSGENDPRITPVGRMIRKCRIDELPQLFNILGGSMSIVGPRPERPEIAAQYEEILPEFRLRLQAKAGLTGYAQVYGKYNTTPYNKLQMDLMYIANPSILEDLRICFATVKILFMSDSTEGIAEGQVTAVQDK